MEIKPSTADRPATIEFSKEDKERIALIGPDFFSNAPDFPEGIYSVKSSSSEARGSTACRVRSEDQNQDVAGD